MSAYFGDLLHVLGWRAFSVSVALFVVCNVAFYYVGRFRQFVKDARKAVDGPRVRGFVSSE